MNRSTDRSISRATEDPAADAAAMLLRLGFAIFALVVPSATLMSRWVIVVLVPIGSILIILSALLRGDAERLLRGIGAIASSLTGLLATCFLLWALTSLLWAPAPDEGAERLFKISGVAALGLLAALSLPERMRASNLHLISIGVTLGAVLILVAAALAALGNTMLIIPAATPGRVAVLLTVLVWAAAAWLLIKNSRGIAAALVATVACVAVFGPANEALMPMLAGMLVFVLAWRTPEKIGRVLAILAALAILSGPLLACLAKTMANALDLPAGHILSRTGLWWTILANDPLHALTGRGFDSAALARLVGFIPLQAPVGLLADIWFDLGLLGALALAGLMAAAFLSASRMGFELAPAALAGITAAFIFAVLERGATQTWWLNGLAVMGIVLAGVERGRYRTLRPRAEVKHVHPDRREYTGNIAGS